MNEACDPPSTSTSQPTRLKHLTAKAAAAVALWIAFSATDLAAETRKWTRNDGRTVTAELLLAEPDHVLLKVKGKEFKVNRADLSKEDIDWLTGSATLTQESVGGSMKPEVDTERAALCLKTGGKPSIYLMSAKLKRIDFKSSDKAILVFEGNLAAPWNGTFLKVDGDTLYTATRPGAQKKKVISVGDTFTLRAKALSTPISFNLSAIGLDRVWFMSNFQWPEI